MLSLETSLDHEQVLWLRCAEGGLISRNQLAHAPEVWAGSIGGRKTCGSLGQHMIILVLTTILILAPGTFPQISRTIGLADP